MAAGTLRKMLMDDAAFQIPLADEAAICIDFIQLVLNESIVGVA
jgi:hypothetical protein